MLLISTDMRYTYYAKTKTELEDFYVRKCARNKINVISYVYASFAFSLSVNTDTFEVGLLRSIQIKLYSMTIQLIKRTHS